MPDIIDYTILARPFKEKHGGAKRSKIKSKATKKARQRNRRS